MSRTFLGLAAALALVVVAPSRQAFAQVAGAGVGSDVFSFYYGYYLPHQAAIAAQPTPLDTINQNIAQRQMAASTDRSALYDPISPYGDEDTDPLSRYSNRGGERRARAQTFNTSPDFNRGGGPAGFYGRTARYFPGMKTGRSPNSNLARVRSGRGGGMGMPGMGMPGAGPR